MPVTNGGDQSEVNWALILIYGTLFALLLASVVLSHLIDLYHAGVERIDADMARKATVLSPDKQKALAVELLSQCLGLNDQAKARGGGLLQAYVGGAPARA